MDVEYIDLGKGYGEVRKEIESKGVSFFKQNFNQGDFLQFGNSFGDIYKHRDSKNNSITIVSNVDEVSNSNEGYKGFTNSSLFPHTDRSTINKPPNILILYCKQQSKKGGETVLIDMKKVLDFCLNKYPSNCFMLNKNSVIFDDGKDKYKGSLIEFLEDGSYGLRFRNDRFGYFNSDIIDYLPEFYKLIEYNKITIKIPPNCGYIINNRRFLHGRSEFNGSREMWRLLIHDNYFKYLGFKL